MVEPRAPTFLVLGIDPGAVTGWCLLDLAPSRPRWLDGGSFRGPLAWLPMWSLAEFVAVESVAGVFPRAGFGTGMATALLHAAELGGRILGQCQVRGVATQQASALEWRRGIVGSAQASDARVKAVLELRVDAMPRTNAHARDAAGVALFCGQRARLARMRVDPPCWAQG